MYDPANDPPDPTADELRMIADEMRGNFGATLNDLTRWGNLLQAIANRIDAVQ